MCTWLLPSCCFCCCCSESRIAVYALASHSVLLPAHLAERPNAQCLSQPIVRQKELCRLIEALHSWLCCRLLRVYTIASCCCIVDRRRVWRHARHAVRCWRKPGTAKSACSYCQRPTAGAGQVLLLAVISSGGCGHSRCCITLHFRLSRSQGEIKSNNNATRDRKHDKGRLPRSISVISTN